MEEMLEKTSSRNGSQKSAQAVASILQVPRQKFWTPYLVFLTLITQGGLDLLTVFVCFMLSYWFYTGPLQGWSPQTLYEFMVLAAGASVLYVIIIDRVGLYRREVSLLNIKELRGIFFVGIYAASVILSLSFYIRDISLSRITFTVALSLTPIALYIQRRISYKIQLLFLQYGITQKRIFIYGAGNIGTHIAKRIFQSPSLGLLPIGFIDDDVSKHTKIIHLSGDGPAAKIPVLGGEEWITECKKYGVSQVLIALPSASFEKNQHLVELCVANGIEYAIVPNAYEKVIQHVEIFEIGGIPLLRRRQRKSSIFYRITKRFIDILVSTILILILSPLIFFIGLAIKIESKGAVIFKQKRVGYKGKEFSFYKFRSMFMDSPKYAKTPSNPNDPRITKVGRWLRRTSLDELPQLFNVFRGDMSLVGPRPEMPFLVASYTPLERERLNAKPGITGVWQISVARSEPIHANIEYDLFYLDNRSLLLDLAILFKTFLSVIRGKGAI